MALKNLQAGVTLIEMVVVVAIIALVSSVMIFNYSDFSTNVSVRNLSQEIALSVRKAQTYATSVRPIEGLSGVDSKTFPGYGISFAVNDQLVAPDDMTPGPRQFILYADASDVSQADDAYIYNQGSTCGSPVVGDECLESFGISTADRIVSICGSPTSTRGSRAQCYTEGKVDITFRRPSPDAMICMSARYPETNDGGLDNGGDVGPVDIGSPELFESCNIPYVTINLESAKGLRRSVSIWTTGQISVQ